MTPTVASLPSPARTGLDRLRTLLQYFPSEWADYHPSEALGPGMHFVDFARMRGDLDCPPITGEDDRNAKLGLISQLNTEGLGLGPMTLASASAFDEWGWDIADVDVMMYCSLNRTWIFLGKFARPEIIDRLSQKGYRGRALEEFTIYTTETEDLKFAVKPNDTLIVGPSESAIEDLIRQKTESRDGMGGHPSVASLLEHLEGAWGAFMAPSGDLAAFWASVRASLDVFPPDVRESLAELYGPGQERQAVWDTMAIAFWGSKRDPTVLSFLYHYPSEEEANKDLALVEIALTTMPSLRPIGRVWADLVTLRNIDVQGTVLKATASTNSKSLIGDAINNRDFGFLPARTVAVTKTVDSDHPPSPVMTTTLTLTSTSQSGWILYEKPGGNFGIGLPPTWKHIEVDPETIDAVVEWYKEQDLEMGSILESQFGETLPLGAMLWGFDLSPESIGSGYAANVQVLWVPLPADVSLGVMVQLVIGQLENLKSVVTPISHQRVDLVAGEAEQIRYEMNFINSGGEPTTLAVIQHLLVHGERAYTITFTTRADQAEEYAPIIEEIVQSFQIIQ
jgi:hypothetical protein